MQDSAAIIFEDPCIAVCLKPAGLLSQAGEGESMLSLLDRHFAENGEKAKAYPVHRLDRETGGVMVYAKDSRSAAALSAEVQSHGLKKRYYAVTNGVPAEASGTLTDLLFRDKQKNKTFVVKRMRKGVREAALDYHVAAESGGKALIEVSLLTGRTHQIRVHMASIGHPILGDDVYCHVRSGYKLQGQTLHAGVLGFIHPSTGEYMEFKAPLPEYFEKLLKDLRNGGSN